MHIVRQTRFLFCAATLLFTASAMLAQTSSAKQIAKQRDSASGMATGRRIYKPLSTASQKSLGSAHATESRTMPPAGTSTTQRGKMSNVQTNPLYEDNQKSGQNPLYEPKDKTVQPPQNSNSASHEVVEYKDGEDQQTRRKSQTAARKSGSVIFLDREGKAASPAKQSPTHSTGATKQ